MKKFLLIIIVMVLMVLCGCNGSSNGTTSSSENSTSTPSTSINQNVLVAYFSQTNTTKDIARKINNSISSDLFEIEAKIPYTEEDLKYYTNCRADKEQADPNVRPAIANSVNNISKYDVIFLGYPIWHGQAPKIMYTFVESYDLSGKTIVPFCTSASSPIGSSATNLAKSASDANWLNGKRFSQSATKSEIESWLKSITY